ncbi:hypothetical protein Pla110_34230 [Polystyrenella longa]|uniref:Uncharacterized protein n=1 Tax=Polystyrenella longa TaxID=2528007 RepID=A0A518CR25_9PLAN|nr:hypothetical protein Pla110_34230 [Polystyrenella longa]
MYMPELKGIYFIRLKETIWAKAHSSLWNVKMIWINNSRFTNGSILP